MQLNLLTYNIHKGLNWSNTVWTLGEMKKFLATMDLDIVFLQEVVGQHQKHEKKFSEWTNNQFEYLADGLWSHYSYAKNAIYDGRDHGNAILSKFPIVEWKQIDISVNPIEQRGVLFAQIQTPLSNINLLCVHLNLTHNDRLKQYQLVKQIIAKLDPKLPLILAGDFNDWNQEASKHFPEFIEGHYKIHGHYAKSFPAVMPFFTLDRIYLKGFKPLDGYVHLSPESNKHSDHLPLWMKVECHGS